MKLSISMADELVSGLDAYAEENYLSRSGVISMACKQFIQAQEVSKALVEMSVQMRRIADSKEMDEESKNALEHFEYLVKTMSTK